MKRPRIQIAGDVLRQIRQHARSSIATEICGVLIGSDEGGATVVEAAIQGEAARQAGSHVTFTQDTWSHIYQIKDAAYPDHRIVGWYHSHPGFGIFLSDHDTFIHRNFFSNPGQIAWVFDPVSDEEGCFAWREGEIARVDEIAVLHDATAAVSSATHDEESIEPELEAEPEAAPSRGNRVARWLVLTITHLLLFALGIGVGAMFFARVVFVPQNGTEVHGK
jgi:proteasome lid subunit RPN8/RPN11